MSLTPFSLREICPFFGLVFIADRVVKIVFLSLLPRHVIVNQGIALGILTRGNWVWVLFTLLILVLSVFLSSRLPVQNWWYGFFWGGLFSNLVDRLIYGGVIDIRMQVLIPAFNLADVCLLLMMMILVRGKIIELYESRDFLARGD